MEDQLIKVYINNFRRKFTPVLKSGVGMQFYIYPYYSGCVMVVELGNALSTKDIWRAKAETITESLNRTQLFEADADLKNPIRTAIFVVGNKIVLVKPSQNEYWTETAVDEDMQRILHNITDTRNQDDKEN